ncbi:type I-F CRISPR-associated protein Csy2 [Fluviispira sanaruensis]|uniref:Uncharacterized protein n=1 Tax=Fluviispira sanaruensis TaxID=2493639 RepID=A0A4P2VIV7_FLUSA|nr:type I-F CRISPR-associated protein Csy2 [Fluviispira sanaruensis]BBH52671.1 hypothetical protein JCM31447_11120 [Fluviispira sanaruensis]
MGYIFIKAKVHDAQAMPNTHILGSPSVIGLYGFLHKLELNSLKFLNLKINFTNFSFALNSRNYFLNYNHPKFNPYHKDLASSKNPNAASTVDTKSMDFEIIIIAQFQTDSDLSNEGLKKYFAENEIVFADLRLCGGVLANEPQVYFDSDAKPLLRKVSRTFYFFCDASSMLESVLHAEESELEKEAQVTIRKDALDSILALTEMGKIEVKKELFNDLGINYIQYERYFPLNVGYISIENKGGKRVPFAEKHFYVESYFTLGKSIPSTVMIRDFEKIWSQTNWTYQCHIDQEYYSIFYCKN